jgi:hypothetical protein
MCVCRTSAETIMVNIRCDLVWARILGCNWDKKLKSFPPCYLHCTNGLKLVCYVNIKYENLKSENSQDYSQKPQLKLYVHEFGFWTACVDGLRQLQEWVPSDQCCEIPILGFIQFPWPWIFSKYGSKITPKSGCGWQSSHNSYEDGIILSVYLSIR